MGTHGPGPSVTVGVSDSGLVTPLIVVGTTQLLALR